MDKKFDLYNWSSNVDGVSSSNRLKYDGILSMVSEETIWNVDKKLESNPEAQQLKTNIIKNLKTYFDKKREPEFMDYDYDIVKGPVYNEKYYEEYQNLLNDYPTLYLELNNERNQIKSKLSFGKKKKLAEIDEKIQKLNNKYDKCIEIRKREKLFENTWIKDGKFVDLNKGFEDRYKEIKEGYIKESIINLFDKHPEFMQFDFSNVEIDPVISKLIGEYQYARENKLEPFNAKLNKNEFGNDDGGAGSNLGIEKDIDFNKTSPKNPPVKLSKTQVNVKNEKNDKKDKEQEIEMQM